MKLGDNTAERMPMPYTMEINKPTRSPGICNSTAMAGAAAGIEYAAIVTRVCTARPMTKAM